LRKDSASHAAISLDLPPMASKDACDRAASSSSQLLNAAMRGNSTDFSG